MRLRDKKNPYRMVQPLLIRNNPDDEIPAIQPRDHLEEEMSTHKTAAMVSMKQNKPKSYEFGWQLQRFRNILLATTGLT
jgi:hypothetical protein